MNIFSKLIIHSQLAPCDIDSVNLYIFAFFNHLCQSKGTVQIYEQFRITLGQFSKHLLFSYLSVKTCVLGTQKNRLNGSFEYPIHMFWLRSKKLIFRYALLSWGLGLGHVICLLYRLLRLTNLQ